MILSNWGDNMSIEEQIGKKIRYRRKELKITQEGLAFMTNLSRQYISDIEKGRKSMTISTLEKIKIALKVKYNYFFSISSGSEANS